LLLLLHRTGIATDKFCLRERRQAGAIGMHSEVM
jgi:hypothetical protein